jgi:hypothetical protein
MAISDIRKSRPSEALDRALGALDGSCRQAIIYHLKHRCQIDLMSEPTLAQIEEAISDLFGEGATIFLARLYAELRHDMAA